MAGVGRPSTSICAEEVGDNEKNVNESTIESLIDVTKNFGDWRLADKLFDVITGAHSRTLFSRHDHMINEFLEYFQDGFLVRDVMAITNILGTLLERHKEHEPYLQHAKCILITLGDHRLKKEGVLEETEFFIPTSNLLSVIGHYLLQNNYPELKINLIMLLIESAGLFKYKPKESSNPYVQSVSDTFMVMSFEDSTVCLSVIGTLRNVIDNQELILLVETLILVHKLIVISSRCCEQIVKSGGPQVLCELMNIVQEVDAGSRVKFWCVEALWLLMKKLPYETVTNLLSSEDSLTSLRNAFFYTLTQSNGRRMKQLRNDFLVLILEIQRQATSKAVLQISFVKELAMVATLPEVKQHHALVAHLRLEEIPEDFQMKQLLFCIIKLLGTNKIYFEALNPPKLMESLAAHIFPLVEYSVDAQKKCCSLNYRKTMQIVAFQTLSYFAPTFIDIFLKQKTHVLLIQQIYWCLSQDVLTAKRPVYERDDLLRYCLQITVKVVDTHNVSLFEELINLRTVPICLTILSETADMPYDAPYIDYVLDIQTFTFIILAALCDSKGAIGIYPECEGGQILIRYLQKLNEKDHSTLPGHNLLTTSVINCFRCCVIGTNYMEESFNAGNGISLLAELLSKSHYAIQGLILSCLVDLSTNPEVRQLLLKWRSPTNGTFPMLLCKVWREEETRMGIKRENPNMGAALSRSASSAIRNIYGSGRLLVGTHQLKIPIEPRASNKLTAAALDVSENCRANIYGLIEQLKEQGGSTESAMHPRELVQLPLEDMTTLAVVEGYLDVKGGEIWTELLEELTSENLEPSPAEQEFIYSVLRLVSNRTGIILGYQRQFRHLRVDQATSEERAYYSQFYRWKNQEKLVLNQIHKYITKLSNTEALAKSKEKEDFELNLERQKTIIKRLEDMKPEQQAKQYYLRHSK